MAYVVRRPGGRWEIRESYLSDAGPRSRTLATFKSFSPSVIERARQAARTPFDPERLLLSAKRAGVPIEPSPGDALAMALLRDLARGSRVRRGLRQLLVDHLGDNTSNGNADDSLAQWVGSSNQERADALIELLDLADRLPKPRKAPLRFPKLSPLRPGE